jgi:hypothetical protein
VQASFRQGALYLEEPQVAEVLAEAEDTRASMVEAVDTRGSMVEAVFAVSACRSKMIRRTKKCLKIR